MSPTYQKQLTINLLQQLRAAGKFGLSVAELQIGSKALGFNQVTRPQIDGEVAVLAAPNKAFVEHVEAEISPEVKSYRLTSAGGDWLAGQNL